MSSQLSDDTFVPRNGVPYEPVSTEYEVITMFNHLLLALLSGEWKHH
jgi:hypothetical protein